MGRLGEARLNTTASVTTHGLSPIVRSARHRRLRRPRWGTASAGHGAEPGRSCSAQCCTAPPAAGPTGAAGCGPQRKLPGAMQPSLPHRLLTYRDAGRERASGAAGRSTCQAGASTSRRPWPWTRMESRASSGPEEEYDLGTISRPETAADWRPVQCRGLPRQRAFCAPPPRSRPTPAAGWRPVQCRCRPRHRASCAPPPPQPVRAGCRLAARAV